MGKPFDIIVCGAGIGGLGAAIALKRKGHQVTVVESASQLNEIGAGIQIPPNCSRILKSYGLENKFLKSVVWPANLKFRRYATGEVIGLTPLHPVMTETYGHPYWLIHRADYQKILYDGALEAGVKVMLGAPISSVDEAGPSLLLKDGRSMKADLVVGADGIRSRCRKSILKDNEREAVDSPNCAYRATVPSQVMNSDPMIAHLMKDTDSNLWMGYERHVIGYPIRNGELYNLVMSHPGKASVGKWNEPGNPDEMRAQYSNWDPIIQRVLTHVTHCLKWKLAYLPPLERWVSDNGRVVVIGDAAHGMVPYLAQGAAVSIEDGSVLAECVDRAHDVSDLPALLLAFQAMRKPRCEMISRGALANGDIWHMPDGPEQEQRDRDMQQKMDGASKANENPNKWNEKAFVDWLFGYNTEKEAKIFLNKLLQNSDKQNEHKL